jgi:hypothetical protein
MSLYTHADDYDPDYAEASDDECKHGCYDECDECSVEDAKRIAREFAAKYAGIEYSSEELSALGDHLTDEGYAFIWTWIRSELEADYLKARMGNGGAAIAAE